MRKPQSRKPIRLRIQRRNIFITNNIAGLHIMSSFEHSDEIGSLSTDVNVRMSMVTTTAPVSVYIATIWGVPSFVMFSFGSSSYQLGCTIVAVSAQWLVEYLNKLYKTSRIRGRPRAYIFAILNAPDCSGCKIAVQRDRCRVVTGADSGPEDVCAIRPSVRTIPSCGLRPLDRPSRKAETKRPFTPATQWRMPLLH